MSTLLGVFRSIAGINKILELLKYFREAWLKQQSAREEAAKNDRNDSAIDELVRLRNTQAGQHSDTAKGPTGGGNGNTTPNGS